MVVVMMLPGLLLLLAAPGLPGLLLLLAAPGLPGLRRRLLAS
jgi:hypothetical protein